jgi:hypothetical protein
MVLLPLPPFIVATVIICLMADLPFRSICVRRITSANVTGFLAAILRMVPVWRGYLGFSAHVPTTECRLPPLLPLWKAYCAGVHDALSTALNMSKDWTRT